MRFESRPISSMNEEKQSGNFAQQALGVFSRYTSTLLLLMVFVVETGVLMFVIRDLRTADDQARRMYVGSVQGLRQIGELQFQAQETRRSTLYALTTNDSNLQVEYADQSREADRRVTEGITEYLKQARMPAEQEVGVRLQQDWAQYLKVRDEVLASILEGSTKEAVDMDLSGGVPSFERVRRDLDEIKRMYDEEASRQLRLVDASSRRSAARLVGVLCFTLLFASVSIWAIQRSRIMGALQLAKLQMDFVASMSHELRTPLAVICSAAENIADGVVEGKDQLKRYGSVIHTHTRQITELVNQILMFASTRDGKSRYMLRPLAVQEVLDVVLQNVSELIRGGGFEVEQEIEKGLPPVKGDPSAMSQCLQNLVVNAVKYSGDARWIGIRAAVERRKDGSAGIAISVQDRGIGIASDEMPRIFEPFYRSPSVALAQIHGTGLGLPLAKSMAEAMGGSLSAVSELGVGSVFTLHLAVAEDGKGMMAGETAEHIGV
jgi:signal transduction histidine kinase